MNKVIIFTALILTILTGCKADLGKEFGLAVEGSWEIHSITYGESDTTIFYTGARPRMEFFPCEKNEVMCPLYLFDQEGDMATYEYRGTFLEKDQPDGGIRFEPGFTNDFATVNDSLRVLQGFSFLLSSDTLFLSEGQIGIGNRFSKNVSLILVREP